MTKKRIIIILCILMMIGCKGQSKDNHAAAEKKKDYTLVVNYEDDVPIDCPVFECEDGKNRVMVPIVAVFEMLGCETETRDGIVEITGDNIQGKNIHLLLDLEKGTLLDAEDTSEDYFDVLPGGSSDDFIHYRVGDELWVCAYYTDYAFYRLDMNCSISLKDQELHVKVFHRLW